jgi:hypothetical protein
MDELDFNSFLERNKAARSMEKSLNDFQANKRDLLQKRGIYVYGEPGSGKTSFVLRQLRSMGYDPVRYDAGDIRNNKIIDTITKHNISDKSVISMFSKKARPIAIVMDEIDGMNSGDKGGINSLIKLIRPKKTKKQKQEDVSYNPIICIGNYRVDKKIKELMKVCDNIELKRPTDQQINRLLATLLPGADSATLDAMRRHVQGDLRKLTYLCDLHKSGKGDLFARTGILSTLRGKSCSEDTKDVTKRLINIPMSLEEHTAVMNETDRTIVGLLWHENIVDVLSKQPIEKAIPFYSRILDNICYADHVDRVTFQKQIWQFNEMSSLIKTMHPNKMYHESFIKKPKYNPTEVRFTKVLTKYSTEYNNSLFIQGLCQEVGMDVKDLFAFFLNLRATHTDDEILPLFDGYEVSKLDINRMYRYLDKLIGCDISDDDASVSSEAV